MLKKGLFIIALLSLVVGMLGYAPTPVAKAGGPWLPEPYEVEVVPAELQVSADNPELKMAVVVKTETGLLSSAALNIIGEGIPGGFIGQVDTGVVEATVAVTTTANIYEGHILIGENRPFTYTVQASEDLVYLARLWYANEKSQDLFLTANEEVELPGIGESVELTLTPALYIFQYEVVAGQATHANVVAPTEVVAGSKGLLSIEVLDQNENRVAEESEFTVSVFDSPAITTTTDNGLAPVSYTAPITAQEGLVAVWFEPFGTGDNLEVIPDEPVALEVKPYGILKAGEVFWFESQLVDQWGNLIEDPASSSWYRVDRPGYEPVIASQSGVALVQPITTESFTTTQAGPVFIGMCVDGFCDEEKVEIEAGKLGILNLKLSRTATINSVFEVIATGSDQWDNEVEDAYKLTAEGAGVSLEMTGTLGVPIQVPTDGITGAIKVEANYQGSHKVVSIVKVTEEEEPAAAAPKADEWVALDSKEMTEVEFGATIEVRQGMTYWEIAEALYGCGNQWEKVQAMDDTPGLQVGEMLTLPDAPAAPVTYY